MLQTWCCTCFLWKLRHVGKVHECCDGCQKSTTGYMATLNPFETTAAGGMVGICCDLTLFSAWPFKGQTPKLQPHTNSHAATLPNLNASLSFKNQFGLWFHRRTAEKKKPCWWICLHSFGLCGTNIPFFSSHFSYENCQKFGFKFTIFGLWHLGAGCAWSDHESVCVYIYKYTYVCTYMSIWLNLFMSVYISN